jgi:O-6-methylguanine DNA methyltransferase
METLQFTLDRFTTPIGVILLVTDDRERLRALDWEEHEDRMRRILQRHYGGAPALVTGRAPLGVRRALEAYFAGDLHALERLPVETRGTPFQREVWAALRRIPVGETTSYGALAASIRRASAVRAVGAANGANPIGVVVPCHRVIGADASLTGFAAGIERKRWLLRHEGVPMKEV